MSESDGSVLAVFALSRGGATSNLLASLTGGKNYTKVDLLRAYQQVQLNDDSCQHVMTKQGYLLR